MYCRDGVNCSCVYCDKKSGFLKILVKLNLIDLQIPSVSLKVLTLIFNFTFFILNFD